ncbi:putative undecaprenyl-phosphate N-acetylglucosaminyl 1-phosphate transferase [Dyadobacter sp. CECT 9623]|uniref:Undecaprenyl-phosphate N-acetylglucosaminyl 1-phosphate transferase n=1 Tax=Dyadobacter linearis TaxID=2823330 RepID=A0ABN7R8N1_9BACT|nr:MraY family glycosyltransferase [Dyadobacter sp. CECT 9623]CAG5070558.1 putative undecaprenyl-phosphate N-acetylglucosaminyl 1-phosphate transferase [Dyadobacter sp. CECT 9623]
MNWPLIFGVSLAAGTLFTWLVRTFALKNNIVNKPNPIVPQHVKPVAYLGGLGIFLGGVTSLAILYYFELLSFPEAGAALGAAGFLILGIFDDLNVYSARKKFAIQLILAFASVAFGVKAAFTNIAAIDFLLSAFWILVLVNAANLTDVCDGLVGGLCMITFMFLAITNQEQAGFALVISGSILGFLIFNSPRASIFLGDAGSHMLGFLLAAITLLRFEHSPTLAELGSFLLVPGVMLFELAFLTVVRIQKGLAWWKGSPDHFSLRLQSAGFTRWQTDVIAWTAQVFILIVAFYTSNVGIIYQLALYLTLFAALSFSWKYLLRHEVQRRT